MWHAFINIFFETPRSSLNLKKFTVARYCSWPCKMHPLALIMKGIGSFLRYALNNIFRSFKNSFWLWFCYNKCFFVFLLCLQSFKQMIASCLVKDPSKRPSAKRLLKHSFFKQARSSDYIARTLLEGLPALGDRIKALKVSLSFLRVWP